MDYRLFNTCECDLFCKHTCVYTQGTSVYRLIQMTFVEFAQNLTPEKSGGGGGGGGTKPRT